jgi:hypothetical protein
MEEEVGGRIKGGTEGHKGRLKDYFNVILVDGAENRYIIK